MNKQQCID